MLHQDFKTSLDTISGVGGFMFFLLYSLCWAANFILIFFSFILKKKSHFPTDLSLIYCHDHVSSLTESMHFVPWMDWFVAVETVLHFSHEILAFHSTFIRDNVLESGLIFFFLCSYFLLSSACFVYQNKATLCDDFLAFLFFMFLAVFSVED